MRPDEFEELLPAYIDGDLNAEQRARVEAWLERSEEARQSLEAYRGIDGALEMRRGQVPPADRFADAVFARERAGQVRRALDAVFSFPGIVSIVLAVFTGVIYIYRDAITGWFDRAPGRLDSGSLGMKWLQTVLLHYSGTDMWTLAAVYAGLTILILLSTTYMLMRFLRD